MRGIADTGFLVALANRTDEHHEWATQLAAQFSEPLLTCEPVLAETAFLVGDVRIALGMLEDGLIVLAFESRDHLTPLGALAERYADRHPDLADLCVIRMSELYPTHSVIRTDRDDFQVYRRNKREVIPTVLPPET
ncbi:MAG: pilus assembly protein [Verrucomicrobiales bacterium]|nr:pilus assembly protein [Verrucomicrobiales bacterium]